MMSQTQTTSRARRAPNAAAVARPEPRGHVLVVEDEPDLQELLRYNLEREGYRVTAVGRGEHALKVAESRHVDLILLDLMLPGMDGLEVCRALRSRSETAAIPIVMVTAKGEEADVVAGLELGADDYVTKPYSPRVLLARLKAVLRCSARARDGQEQSATRIDRLTIDPSRHEVRVDDELVALTYTEFRMLDLLARRPGRVFTRPQIVRSVQGDNVVVTDRSVDVHIASLRKKLGVAGQQIQTVRGVGYRLEES